MNAFVFSLVFAAGGIVGTLIAAAIYLGMIRELKSQAKTAYQRGYERARKDASGFGGRRGGKANA